MGGGLMQLVAYGAQDIYLTGSPQITFFKVVYRRHTNFSMESIQQTWNGQVAPDARCTATISRNGDLIHKMYVQMTNGTINASFNPGACLLKEVELEIGGQRIDKHYGHWLETWAELTESSGGSPLTDGHGGSTIHGLTNYAQFLSGSLFIGGNGFQKMSGMGGVIGWDNTFGAPTWGVPSISITSDTPLYIPLQFWFCRNPGLALPLIALQYHEVKVIATFENSTVLTNSPKCDLWVDYIYLDTEERRRFAQVSHEYLIEQVQHQTLSGMKTGAKSHDLHFNHPVKELIWTGAWNAAATNGSKRGIIDSLTAGDGGSACQWKLKLNGHDRFAQRPTSYFTRVQRKQYHSNGVSGSLDNIAVYSFALKPEEHQPSGTCNFSRIDTAQLEQSAAVDDSDFSVGSDGNVYAVNYNILRIMSGMGGLAYSN
jgi:hypothetical protein